MGVSKNNIFKYDDVLERQEVTNNIQIALNSLYNLPIFHYNNLTIFQLKNILNPLSLAGSIEGLNKQEST